MLNLLDYVYKYKNKVIFFSILLFVIHSFFFVFSLGVNTPQSDELDFILFVKTFFDGGPWWQDSHFLQHYDHRLIIPSLIFLASSIFDKGNIVNQMYLAISFLTIGTITLYYLLKKTNNQLTWLSIPIAAIIFNAGQYGCYLWGACAVSWNKQYKVPTKIARIFHTYGPGMKLDDGRVFADFVADVVNNKNITIRSDGMAKRPFCYIRDATIAFFLILTKGKNAEAYNVSNPNCIATVSELAEIISKLFPEKRIKIIYGNEPPENEYMKSTVDNYTPNITKIKKLNWEPEVTIKEGFLRTIKSYL